MTVLSQGKALCKQPHSTKQCVCVCAYMCVRRSVKFPTMCACEEKNKDRNRVHLYVCCIMCVCSCQKCLLIAVEVKVAQVTDKVYR